jgi:hypothetical protein
MPRWSVDIIRHRAEHLGEVDAVSSGSALSKMDEKGIDSLANYIDRYIQGFPPTRDDTFG